MRFYILIFFIIGGFFFAFPCHADTLPSTEEELLSLGSSEVARGNLDDALRIYDSVIQLNPLSDRAYNARGVILLRMGQCEKASGNFIQATKIAPGNSVLQLNLALAEECAGKTGQAATTLNKILSNNSQDEGAWMTLASVYEQGGNFTDALHAYDSVIAINRSNTEAWIRKSVLLANLGQYPDAMDSFNNSLNISPDNPTILYNKGVLLEKMNQFRDAIGVYNRVIALEPNSSKAWLNKGSIYWNHNRLNESLTALDTALSIDPNISEAWFTRGLIQRSLGEYNESASSFERAYQIRPDDTMYRAYRDRYKQISGTGMKKRIIPLSMSTILLSFILSLGIISITKKRNN